MRTLHLIYTVPRGGLLDRIEDRFVKVFGLPPSYRNGSTRRFRRPLRSPHSVSYHLLEALKKKYRVKLYSMYEHGVADTAPGDIVLAQPAPVLPHVPPQEIDKKAITYRTFTERKDITKIIIMPYSHDETYTRWWRDLVRDHGTNCIFISGEPWMATWEEKSPFRDLPIQNKLRIDVCIDAEDFPLIKHSFNSPRGVFYIGHTSWYKNTRMLEAIAEAMPDTKFGHVGLGEVQGFEKVSDFAALTPDFLRKLSKTYDIFINASTGDPNATTVVEMLSSGFPVACTPQTGYEGPWYTKLSTNDVAGNVEVLRGLQALSDEELIRRGREGSEYARKHFSWERVMQDVVAFVERVS
jgi:glycosyltransferase involved in cell wall biosynthesis